MIISVSFHIDLLVYKPKRFYRILVEHYYSSDQVERFRLKGKAGREILMEKRLVKKRLPWKIIAGNIDTTNVERTTVAIRDIQDAIDRYLEVRKIDPQNDGYISPEVIRKELEKIKKMG